VRSSEHNRGGVKRDADEGHRVPQVLETGQNGRGHLGRYLRHCDILRRRVWIIGRRAALHREVTRSCGAPLYVQTRPCTRYRTLFGCQKIQRGMESLYS